MEISMKEQARIEVVQQVMTGRIDKLSGARLLDCSYRHLNRLLVKMDQEGLKGLIHGNRGRVSPRKTPESVATRIVDWAQGRYRDINDTHLQEILKREEGIVIGRETLRGLLRRAGIAAKRKRRPGKYRARRERKEAFGMMIQIDASPHNWLEDRGPWLTLVGGKDDATGYVWARFEKSECTWAYFRLIEDIASSHGLPLSLYSDRHTIFHVLRAPTVIEQLQGAHPLTQFGQAMESLGIRLIKAWSPQAKGRIERNWGIFQDRLVAEMRLAKANTLEEANTVLKGFLRDYNRRFIKAPKVREPVFRRAPTPQDLARILCLQETRTVAKDHTISFEGLTLQIPSIKGLHAIAGKKVQVLQLSDASVEIVYQQRCLARFSPEAMARLLKQNRKENHLLKTAA